MKLTIKARLFLGFGLMALLFIVSGYIAVESLTEINASNDQLALQSLPSIDYVHSINTAVSTYRVKELRYAITDDQETLTGLEAEMKELNDTVNENVRNYDEIVLEGEDKELFNEIKQGWEDYLVISNQVLELSREGKKDEAVALANGQAKEAYVEENAKLNALVELNQVEATKVMNDASSTYNDTKIILYTSIAVSIVSCLALSIIITRSIIKPVNKLIHVADALALGKVNVDINATSKDEIGKLMKSFEKMVNNIRAQALAAEKIASGDLTVEVPINSPEDLLGNKLNEMVKKNNEALASIYLASEQVAVGAKQVSDSSILLSEGATEQASAIEELTASIDEISSQTDLNAENANEANALAEEAKSNAQLGNQQMQDMLKAMDEINEASNNISKVIKVIDDIAFQTNILALNAAVEAARAGQHGKGFAVVAEEVRNLAARSANAAKETTDMIEGSIKKSEGGTRIAKETAQALDKIVDGIEQVAKLVDNIAKASNEQSVGIKQINQGILQVSQVVQSNSSTSEESAAASEELSSQANFLKETVNQFKIKMNSNTHNGYENVHPDVLKMLDNMSNTSNLANQNLETIENEKYANNKISLSDTDFGKY